MRIRGKLVAIVMTATAVALLLAGAVLLLVERNRLRHDLLEDLSSLSAIVADSTTAALAFDDPDAAREVLRSLRAKSHLAAACVYDERGALFASFGRRDELGRCPPRAPRGEGVRLHGGAAERWQQVTLGERPAGAVLLRSDLSTLGARLRLQLLALLAALMVAALGALLLSVRLQRVVSQPVADLAGVAAEVRRGGDYSLRAAPRSGPGQGGDDEIDELVASFNLMLEQIQSRDAALQQGKEALEGRVAERTRELDAELAERRRAEAELASRNQELAASNRELDDFAYVASHDLKEPLRGIHNYAGFLLEDYGHRLPPDGVDKLQTLMRLSGRMEALIDNLLHYSRVGRVDLAIEEVDLQAMLVELLDSLAPLLAEANAVVVVDHPLPTVRCDRARIDEVFRNLLVNGVKYNDRQEKHIHVGTLSAGSRAGGVDATAAEGPIFYVRDDGIGIPVRHQRVIFDIFKRLHGRDAYGGGSGAGLTIVKKVVERHGGRIWLQSEPGVGTTFFFTLQAAEPAGSRHA